MLEFFYRGGPVMYPLLFCSLLSLTIIIERFIFWMREERNRDRKVLTRFMELIETNDLTGAKEITKDTRDFVIRVLVCGIVHREFSLRDALQMSADEEIGRMRKYLPILDTMITLAPLLGILGTVIGIIRSFNMLGAIGVENPGMITAGIGQALITTAFGLIIAIFALIPFNYFQSRVDKAVSEMEKFGTNLEIIVEKNKNGADSKP
ncbi:MAG: MotA/TolQ/ExbB proton channel family protein [Deltaproteobacteria bacterium]|nr:MotA/TolQ/ExbB proton channel family protein [Deltaproteobacteria bacterium]MBN2844669.1 MotA/TolQ/ExbB proton channel family protein [Deltaproteobacteria bacterium]